MLVTNLESASNAKRKRSESSGISPARLTAFRILKRVEDEGAYASVLLANQDDSLSAKDRALAHELTMGVLRWQLTLDHLIAHYANRDSRRLDLAARISLRLGLYQLRFLTRIPASAAVNDAVKLVQFARIRSADKFVNAVLRRAIRESEYDPLSVVSDPLERLALETSHPRWLIERWADNFGLEEATAFARANNEAAPVSFRITGNNTDGNEVLEQLRAAGASLTPSGVVNDAWRISGGTTLLRRLAREGRVYVQDEASQLVAHALAPQAGEHVLDLCAAPGSKTTHVAALANGEATVIAGDLYQHRLRTVVDAVRSQQVNRVYCVVLDGEQGLPFAEAGFDRVLVDAPCSGTGTLRHNPEIRWRISAADIKQLAGRQRHLLLNAAKAVKPGGRLVYSTCSVETEENEEVIEAWLEFHPTFDRIQLPLPLELLTESGAARTWPHRQGTDGFFIAVFQRKS